MTNSTLYRIHPDEKLLQAVKEIDFSEFNFKERHDIQEWVEATPEILGEELLIIAKELNYFDNTRERPDLIALDKSGNTVIIELKRDDSGTGVEWQAIKYASYLSKFKVSDIIEVYSRYLERYSKVNTINPEEVSQKILDFIEEEGLESLNQNQRIILVSHRFAREVTSAVHWLIDKHNINIKAVQLIPYYDIDRNTYYLQANMILPIPGEEDLIIKASGNASKGNTIGVGAVKKSDDITSFFESVKSSLFDKLDRRLIPNKISRWAGVADGFRYYHFWYDNAPWDNWYLSYKVWLFDDKYTRKERRHKFGIYFEYNSKYLLNRGVSEGVINEINLYIKSINQNGFQYNESKYNYFLEKYLPNQEMSDLNRHQIVNDLEFLITQTKDKIDEVLHKEFM